MASRALTATVLLAVAFGAALWVADIAGYSHKLGDKATAATSGGDTTPADAVTAPLFLVSVTYFLTVTMVYLDLIVIANPDMIPLQRLAAATVNVAAATSLLVLCAAVYESGRPPY